ncbi:uncharacterized protein N7483_009459 [Penicillium malachiteum]|uniref:uncharacterized protein n=1 Tax=Penicillium malachiteum TaxID=1324776 RepID=UPI002546E623|nr:uncharacterized protein N7483_009459 [Penicillium malachiteum]KAJ5721525.1 hypothetical protein N7483_009459 [Penicillium malachiteum]
MEHIKTYNLTVFPSPSDPENGGNPTTIFLADTLTASEMQSLAPKHKHECGFILPAPENDASCHYTMRYWVPNHEMKMCGHAIVGAVWVLRNLQLLPDAPSIRISTLSGVVEVRVVPTGNPDSTSETAPSSHSILVSQPTGIVEDIDPEHILEILNSLDLKETDLVPGLKVQNARTESPIVVRQGWLMGKPSEIRVWFRRECGVLVGCWISGEVRWVKE